LQAQAKGFLSVVFRRAVWMSAARYRSARLWADRQS
jgi:hypothetical protein